MIQHDDLLDDPWFERTGPLAAPMLLAERQAPVVPPAPRRPMCERVAMVPLAKPD